jgi:hypothetical protein
MRQQVSLLRDVLSNMILHRGTDYFTACYEVYHYLENTLQGLPTADSLVHHVDFTTLRRLIAAGVTPVDIQEAKNIEKANYHLVRNIMLELIKDEGLGVFDAVKEIKHVLGHGNQHYAGTYKARLLAANLLPIDTNHAFTQYHLEAMHHMLQELTLRPDEVFQKIYSSAEKEIKRSPLLLREIQGMLVTIGAPLITANFSAADFSRLVLQRNITQNKLLTEQQARTISQMDMFFFQKLFTRKFLAELTRTARIK